MTKQVTNGRVLSEQAVVHLFNKHKRQLSGDRLVFLSRLVRADEMTEVRVLSYENAMKVTERLIDESTPFVMIPEPCDVYCFIAVSDKVATLGKLVATPEQVSLWVGGFDAEEEEVA